MENQIQLSEANRAYLQANAQKEKQQATVPQQPQKIKNGDKKLKKALIALSAAGAAIALGVGIYNYG